MFYHTAKQAHTLKFTHKTKFNTFMFEEQNIGRKKPNSILPYVNVSLCNWQLMHLDAPDIIMTRPTVFWSGASRAASKWVKKRNIFGVKSSPRTPRFIW
jgi:hypothetical protein